MLPVDSLPGKKSMNKKRRKIAIVFDIDGTIVKPISSWRYIHEKLGNWDVLAHKYQDMFLAGKISYRKFCELDAAHWKGMPEDKISRLFKNVPYSKNAKKVLRKFKEKQFYLIAISTGLQYIPEKINKEIGFDVVVSNKLLSRKGVLNGKVKINISHGQKGKILKKIFKQLKISPENAICIGDSDGDIPMAKICGFSIAFNSKSKKLNKIVNYVCKTNDFNEIWKQVKEFHKNSLIP